MLWQRKRKWHYFDTGVLAVDGRSAVFLKDWYKAQMLKGKLALRFEVIDLQRYKKITQSNKVQSEMRERFNIPFVFFVCKN